MCYFRNIKFPWVSNDGQWFLTSFGSIAPLSLSLCISLIFSDIRAKKKFLWCFYQSQVATARISKWKVGKKSTILRLYYVKGHEGSTLHRSYQLIWLEGRNKTNAPSKKTATKCQNEHSTKTEMAAIANVAFFNQSRDMTIVLIYYYTATPDKLFHNIPNKCQRIFFTMYSQHF